jgi:type II secretory pathway pseudopilin PulG
MDGISIPLLALAILGVAAGGAALWQQRRFVADLKRQLAQAEHARRELAEQMRELALHLQARPAAPGEAPDDAAERKRALERALDAAGPAADFPWLETMPHDAPTERYDFAATEPAIDIPTDRR